MKKFLLTITALLPVLSASAATDKDPTLRCDSVVFKGNSIADLTQCIEVSLYNETDTGISNRFCLLVDNHTNGNRYIAIDTLVTVEAQQPYILRLYATLPEGSLTLILTTNTKGEQTLGSMNVNIQPFRKLDFSATFTLDMLTERNSENVLYGSLMRGRVFVKNHEGPFFGANDGSADDGVVLYIEDLDTGIRLFTKHMADWLGYHGSTDTKFCHDNVFRNGAHYALKAAYSTAHGLEPIDSLCFITLNGTNTYWTADGRVLPLSFSDKNSTTGEDYLLLKIPAEAVAVDLRGQHTFNGAFSIDASGANPNCLYYLDLLDNVPQGLDDSCNLIRGLEAINIKLTEGHDYFCPLAFHTQFISYMMTPSYDNADDELRARGYSETIVLPFHPNNVSLYEINGDTEMLHSDMLKVLSYHGCNADTLTVFELTSMSQMKAYEPYILGVYIGSSLLFTSENTQVPMTGEAIVHGGDIDFVGTTVTMPLSPGYYIYTPSDYCFRQGDVDDVIAPFHACLFDADGWSHGQLNLSDYAWGSKGEPGNATAIDYIWTSDVPFNSKVISDISGRQIVNRESGTRQLPKGVYIVSGRKVVVK